jgi:single-strand DNA-binding protein
MLKTLNKVMLIGNVGREPELKHTPSGIPVTSFAIVTANRWRDRSGVMQIHLDWHQIVAWRELAEVCQKIIRKGERIYVEGKIQTRSFNDKNGLKKNTVEILADNILTIDYQPRRNDAKKQKNTSKAERVAAMVDNVIDDAETFTITSFDTDMEDFLANIDVEAATIDLDEEATSIF